MLSFFQLFLPINESFKFDVIQTLFYLSMIGLGIWSIRSLRKHANEKSWEKNWTNNPNTINDDIGVEHGSVVELCQIVATIPEQFAEILPGIMVTLGLLGTFVGLAQSLGEAAMTISSSMSQLADSSTNFGTMESALTGMIGMLQGMGTQFKTSIWGILAFLFLRIYYRKLGFAGLRLKWTISKMRLDNQIKLDSENKHMTNLLDQVIHELDQNNKSLCEILNTQNVSLLEKIGTSIQSLVNMMDVQSNRSTTEREKRIGELQSALISNSNTQFSTLQGAWDSYSKTLSQTILDNTTAITSASGVVKTEIENQATGIIHAIQTQRNSAIDSNKEALSELQQSLNDNSEAQFTKLQAALASNRERIEKAVQDNSTAITSASGVVKTEIENQAAGLIGVIEAKGNTAIESNKAAIDKLQQGLTHYTNEQFDKLHTALTSHREQTEKAIQSNVLSVTNSLNESKAVLLNQTDGILEKLESHNARFDTFSEECSTRITSLIEYAKKTAVNTEQFRAAIENFANSVQGSIDKISTAANRVQESAIQLANVVTTLDKKIGSTLENMSKAISDTILKMNTSFNENIKKTEEALTKSADGISTQVQKMSKELGSNISTFDQTMKSATQQLSATINNMQNNIKDVLGNIKKELSTTVKEMNDSFSENLRKNAVIFNQSVNNITDAVKKMSSTMDSKLKEFSEMTSSSTDNLKKTITDMRNTIKEILSTLNEEIGSTMDRMNSLIDESTKSLKLSVMGISTAAATMEAQIKDSFIEFNKSMGTLVEKQDKSLQRFDSSMNVVSENITEVTGEFKKLKEKLELSLSVVSSSNRDLKNSLESMKGIHREHKEFIGSLEKAVEKFGENPMFGSKGCNKDE